MELIVEEVKKYKKLIIINWKFRENYQELWEIEDVEGCGVVCVNNNDITIFNKSLSSYSSELCIILLHKNYPNEKVNINNLVINRDLGIVKEYSFGGGDDEIYCTDTDGLLFANGNSLDNSCLTKGKVNKKYFEFVWDWYWNKLDLQYQKKQIINLWLPLAIDIQGLSEVEESKRNAYLNEVLAELEKEENGKKYADFLIEGWTEVKKILLPEDGKQVLEEKYQIKPDEIEKVKFPIEKEKENENNFKKLSPENLKSFIEENYKNHSVPNFLPNWLQEVVRVIDSTLNDKK